MSHPFQPLGARSATRSSARIDHANDLGSTFVKDLITWFGYDELGIRTRQVDAKATNGNDATRTTYFEYDRLGRLARKICPANTDGIHDVERDEYDANSNRTEKHDETLDTNR